MAKKPQISKEVSAKTYVLLVLLAVLIVIAFGSISYFSDQQDRKLGEAFCNYYNVSYWTTNGQHIHCYRQDNTTAMKQDIDVWVDMDLAKQIYLK